MSRLYTWTCLCKLHPRRQRGHLRQMLGPVEKKGVRCWEGCESPGVSFPAASYAAKRQGRVKRTFSKRTWRGHGLFALDTAAAGAFNSTTLPLLAGSTTILRPGEARSPIATECYHRQSIHDRALESNQDYRGP